MSEKQKTTRSVYRYGVVAVEDLIPEQGGEGSFTWTCQVDDCGLAVQGGRKALVEHVKTVHPEHEGIGWFTP